MNVNGHPQRTIWTTADNTAVEIIDQTKLPHEFVTVRLESMRDAERAIREMQVRGAPLIGVTAAYGVALSMRHHASDAALKATCDMLLAARPTAVNLRWGVERMRALLAPLAAEQRAAAAWREAALIAEEDVQINRAIGQHGYDLIREIYLQKKSTVNVLTHCNAGWLATVDWGTALAPIYRAHDEGIALHVWVDETRPRNQGAGLTAWELGQHGVPHTVIADNAGGHLMQHGKVDLCIVGTDRVTRAGDVANKIGTYLKALAAQDNGVPFWVALPSPTIDWTLQNGVQEIPIEERAAQEVTHISGLADDGKIHTVRATPADTPVANYGFDVTPARLVPALITERGVVHADEKSLRELLLENSH